MGFNPRIAAKSLRELGAERWQIEGVEVKKDCLVRWCQVVPLPHIRPLPLLIDCATRLELAE